MGLEAVKPKCLVRNVFHWGDWVRPEKQENYEDHEVSQIPKEDGIQDERG